jgi:hypothetical protein
MTLVLLAFEPSFQMLMLAIFNIVAITYQLVYKPYKSKKLKINLSASTFFFNILMDTTMILLIGCSYNDHRNLAAALD